MRTTTEAQDLRTSADMVDGDLLELGEKAVADIIGPDRRASMPPVPKNMNLMSKYLSVVASAYNRTAVTGLAPQVAALLRDGSSPVTKTALASIKAIPYPTSLLVGDGRYRALRQVLRYVCGCGFGAAFVGYAPRSKRIYVRAIRPDAIEIRYSDDDPTLIVGIRWTRTRTIDATEQTAIDEWDISDPSRPVFRVTVAGEDVTTKTPSARPGYWWLDSDGEPFIPIVIWGSPAHVREMSNIIEGVRSSLTYRLCFAAAMVDSGFPIDHVLGLEVASTSDSVTGQKTVAVNRGDTIHWRAKNDTERSEHWRTEAGGDPEAILRACHADEQDTVSQLGFPLQIESTGGAPADAQIASQEQAAQAFYDVARIGDYELFRIITTIANRISPAGWVKAKEDGFGSLYGGEIDKAIEKSTAKEDNGEDAGRTRIGDEEANGGDRGGASPGEDPGTGEGEKGGGGEDRPA
jgi:hypothetical protein